MKKILGWLTSCLAAYLAGRVAREAAARARWQDDDRSARRNFAYELDEPRYETVKRMR